MKMDQANASCGVETRLERIEGESAGPGSRLREVVWSSVS
jgi:hypothetical protein